MKKIIFSVIAGVLFYLTGVSQTVMTLRQCIETGIENNFDVQRRDLQARSDKANWKQSRLNILPDLNASAGHSFNSGRSIDPYTNAVVTEDFNSSNYGISSNVVLFNGLSIQNSIKQNELTYKAATMELQQEKDNLTVNIILAYLQVLGNTDLVEQSRNQLALSGKQLERLEILHKQGATRPSNYSDLKGQYAGDQVAIVNAQNALETSKISLCRLMNVPYIKDLQLEKLTQESFSPQYSADAASIYQTAVETLAMVKAVDFRQRSAKKGVQVARGQLFPTLSFGAGASTNYVNVAKQNQYLNTIYAPTSDSAIANGVKYPVFRYQDQFTMPTKIPYADQLDNNLRTFYGFNLSIPIFNNFFQRNRVKQAKINYQVAELTAKNTRKELSRDIDLAYVNMVSVAERQKALMEQVAALTESFQAAEVLFQQGVGNSVDYLTAKNNLDRANINLIIARYDYILRTKILDYYQGKQLW